MTPPPSAQPGSNIAFWILFGLFVLGEYVMQFRSARDELRHRSGTRVERWSLLAVVVGVIGGLLGGLGVAELPAGRVGEATWPLFILGLVLMAAGIALRQWAMLVLGRYFTPDVRVHPGQEVIQRGPYRWVRHPSYAGMIVFFLGLGLALSSWASLLVLAVVPTAGLVVRIRTEERALLAALGDSYRQFARGRARLLPGVW
ncbi:MAG: methyltransferase family protein [Candidatus Dormibacteria bacterium]